MTVPDSLHSTNQPRRGRWRLLLLWLLALALGGAVASQLPLAAIANTVSSLAPQHWLAWLAVNMVVVVAAVRRWQLLHRVFDAKVGFGQLLIIRQAGQTVNFITPGPQFGGEPLQIVWLWRRGVDLPSAALALGLDRCFELAVNLLVLLLAVALLAFVQTAVGVEWTAVLAGLTVLGVAIVGFAFSLARNPEPLSNRLKSLAQRWRAHRYFRDMPFQGFSIDMSRIRSMLPKSVVMALALSLAGWCGLLAELWLLLYMVGEPPEFSTFLLVLVAMRLAFLLPLPGSVGSLEAALFGAFQYLQAAPETAIALIALMRLRDAVLLSAGFACLAALAVGSDKWSPHDARSELP